MANERLSWCPSKPPAQRSTIRHVARSTIRHVAPAKAFSSNFASEREKRTGRYHIGCRRGVASSSARDAKEEKAMEACQVAIVFPPDRAGYWILAWQLERFSWQPDRKSTRLNSSHANISY